MKQLSDMPKPGLSVKIGNNLARELIFDDIMHVYWTDSKIVLGYINNDAKTFHILLLTTYKRSVSVHHLLTGDMIERQTTQLTQLLKVWMCSTYTEHYVVEWTGVCKLESVISSCLGY